jgi:hypothetical protein
MSLQEHQHV